MNFTEIKIALIDKISEYHPASKAGKKRGWNHYVGGMTDTGDWYKWKMLKEASISDLEQCLEELEEEHKPLPPYQYTEEELQDLNTIVTLPNGIIINLFELKKINEIFEKQTSHMLWGK